MNSNRFTESLYVYTPCEWHMPDVSGQEREELIWL
jgi:hypothetical protein